MGNVRDRPFSLLWNDADDPVLSRFRTRPATVGGKCGSCTYPSLCGGGCRVRAWATSGDVTDEDPFCYVNGPEDKEKLNPGRCLPTV